MSVGDDRSLVVIDRSVVVDVYRVLVLLLNTVGLLFTAVDVVAVNDDDDNDVNVDDEVDTGLCVVGFIFEIDDVLNDDVVVAADVGIGLVVVIVVGFFVNSDCCE